MLFIISVCFASDDPYEKIFQTKLSKLNPKETTFPGGRGADELVGYTSGFGKNTGTNEWGTEAVIMDDRITSIGGNNSEIPENGWVISGHGKSAKWINDNCNIGMLVKRIGLDLTVTEDAKSFIIRYEKDLGKIEKLFQRKKDQIPPENKKNITKILAELKKKPPTLTENKCSKCAYRKFHFLMKSLNEKLLNIRLLSEPSKAEEIRAAWFRLVYSEEQKIRALVRRLSHAGFNVLYPETIYWGQTLYPHGEIKVGDKIYGEDLIPQISIGKNIDILKIMIDEAHKSKMAVHVWSHVFFWGIDDENPLLKSHPQWRAVDRLGNLTSMQEKVQVSEKGYCYLCPANPEVHNLILGIYRDLLERYPIDGLQLDYIRYPAITHYNQGFCYCDYCRKQFKMESGFDPMDISPDNKEAWEKWKTWREDQVTSFIKKVRNLIDEVKPEVKLSAAVFPDIEEARNKKNQNWPEWTKTELLDYIAFMAYSTDPEQVKKWSLQKGQEKSLENTPYIVGLAPYMGLSLSQILDQMDEVQETPASGYAFFAEPNITWEMRNSFRKGYFRQPAWHPEIGNKPENVFMK